MLFKRKLYALQVFGALIAILFVNKIQAQSKNDGPDALKKNEDSSKLHPHPGKFRFWVSDIDKAGYSRTTYSMDADSVIIKKGPYDFIYLAKNYPRDSVYFKRALSKKEKVLLANIETQIGADTLKDTYTNFCIIDGSILSFSFQSAKFSKDVTVSNYYHESIAKVIELLNKLSPNKYRVWYNKETLLKQQGECDKQIIKIK